MSDHLTLPNLDGLDRFAFEPRRVDKPWGYELIWALTDDYCGKVLFVKAGESLRSSSTARRTRPGTSSRAGRDRGRGRPGDKCSNVGGRRRRRRLPLPAGDGPPRDALEDTTILEVSTPQLEDVVRLEDNYGREALEP